MEREKREERKYCRKGKGKDILVEKKKKFEKEKKRQEKKKEKKKTIVG